MCQEGTHPGHVGLAAVELRLETVLLSRCVAGTSAIGGSVACHARLRARLLPCLRVQLAKPLHGAGHLIQPKVSLCWPELEVQEVEGLCSVNDADGWGVTVQAGSRAGALHAHRGRGRLSLPPVRCVSAAEGGKQSCTKTRFLTERTANSWIHYQLPLDCRSRSDLQSCTVLSRRDRLQIQTCGPAKDAREVAP